MTRVLVTLAALLALAPSAHAYREREVREAVRAAGFPEHADRAAKAARVSVEIDRTRLRRLPRALGSSRFGGLPDLPAGERWPQCAGRPQSFLAQLRVRDLPKAAGELRRLGGTLLFFTQVELETPTDTDYGIDAARCTTVLHARAGRSRVRTRRPRAVLHVRPASMRFTPRPDLPDTTARGWLSPPLRDLSIPFADEERWWNLRRRLLGSPADPEHRALGHLGQVNGETGRCWWNTQRRRSPWRPLFTVGYDEGIDFEVADGGRLQIVVAPSDLRRGRFDRVCGIFDSA